MSGTKLRKRDYGKLVVLMAVGALIIFVTYVLVCESRGGVLKVAFLDVGQGDSIFIESPTGRQVLIDGGQNRTVLRRLGSVLPFYDRTIDLIMETHPDHDHSGGLPLVLAVYDADALVRTGSEEDSDSAKLIALAENKEMLVITARRGQIIDLGGGATLKILFPDRFLKDTDTNMKSIVSMLSYGSTNVLLMADAPSNIEHYLMQLDGKNLQADILKNGHHGSKTSSAEDFVALVDPEYAILSLGKDNRYGHPNREVLDVLDRLKVTTLRTDTDGTIVFTSDGIQVVHIP